MGVAAAYSIHVVYGAVFCYEGIYHNCERTSI